MRLPATVVVSLALHVGGLLWVLSRPRTTAKPLVSKALVVDVVWEEPAPPPLPEPTPEKPTPRPTPPRQAAKPVREASQVAPPQPTEPVLPEPLADALVIAPRPNDTAPSLQLSTSFRLAVPDAGFAPGELAQTAKPRNGHELITGIARDTIGRGKVDRGLVHPYFAELGKALLKTWDVDRSVKETGLKGLAQNVQKNAQALNSIWLERAAIFARTGSPIDAPTSRTPVMPSNNVPGMNFFPGQQDPQVRKEMGKVIGEAFRSTRRATLRVVQARDGRLMDVAIVEPSNDLNVDREAIVDVRAAAERLPKPPPEAIGQRETFASLWNFELVVSITPPIPTITFEFDEAIGFIDTRLPLDRRIYKKVKLVSVETD